MPSTTPSGERATTSRRGARRWGVTAWWWRELTTALASPACPSGRRALIRRPSRRTSEAVYQQLALGDGRDAGDHADGARLAGAVGPQEAEALTGEDIEVDAVNGGKGAEALDQAPGADNGWGVAGHKLAVAEKPGRRVASALGRLCWGEDYSSSSSSLSGSVAFR